MTGSQYKNIIENTLLDETFEGVTDSVTLARAVFDNCGIPLPQGNCSDIMRALSTDDFVGWRECTLGEAQEHANSGIAAIGISDERIVIVEPQDSKVLSESLPTTVVYRSNVATIDSLDSIDTAGMIYYADTMGTTTQPIFKIIGKPLNDRMIINEKVKIGFESNEYGILDSIVWSSSDRNVASLSSAIGTATTTITAKAHGPTKITLTSFSPPREDHFDLTVEPLYRIINKPINNTMIVGETKTVHLDSDIPYAAMDTIWVSSHRNFATLSQSLDGSSAVITALSPGTSEISAGNQSHWISDDFMLTVKPSELIVTGKPEYNTMYVGDTKAMNAYLSPDLLNDCLANWSCSSDGFSFKYISDNHQYMEIKAIKPGLHTINVTKDNLSYSFKVFVIKQLYLTNNQCYLESPSMTQIKGIMVHSTGANNKTLKRYVGPDDGLLGYNENNNHWNVYHPGHIANGPYKDPHEYNNTSLCEVCGGKPVCVHAFIGKLEDGTIATYQTLPWNKKGWHSGSGFLGSQNNANNTGFIGFEICEHIGNQDYFYKSYQETVRLCAYLCKKYNINPLQHDADGGIISHKEGHSLGIASDHGDPTHWWNAYYENTEELEPEKYIYWRNPEYKYLNKTMDDFRNDVQLLMNNNMQF